jgi:outer membrane receptor protein involved in Fe transport
MHLLAKRILLLCGSTSLCWCGLGPAALAQSAPAAAQQLPALVITSPKPKSPHRRRTVRRRAHRTQPVPVASTAPAAAPVPTATETLDSETRTFDAARRAIVAPAGANTYAVSRRTIESQPQGTNASLDKVLLQTPGVTQDSAASGEIHVRNEHANVQYRINGIALPDGVSGFGQFLDTSFVGSLALITGALPAQYGLRTAGVVDIQSRVSAFDGGSVSFYGGSRSTFTPSFEYGGSSGRTEYYVSGRYFQSSEGLENPTANTNAIHDDTVQGRGFAYISTVLDPTTRLTFMGGSSINNYQIPNNPGQDPQFDVPGVTGFDSAMLNERQYEQTHFGILALQKSDGPLDWQVSAFTKYSDLHFAPDPIGDLVFNGVASNVYRRSFTNGIQTDASYRINDIHTLHFGATVSAEQGYVANASTALRVDADGNQLPDFSSLSVNDTSTKLGWLFSAYLADEWKLTDKLTLNAGIRFDQMWQYVDANQFSPRISLTYKPFDGTTFHAGYARYFTPPSLVLAAPSNIALLDGTTQQAAVTQNDPVLPERSHYFDVGVTQKILPGLEVGIDGYYKLATDLLDDGQFGAAYVLTGFNYAKARNAGVEVKAAYTSGNLRLYGNVAWGQQKGTNIVSNQYLFDPDELAYIATHYIYTDHSQIWTATVGGSYRWDDTTLSLSMIYGSGLRADSPDGVPNGGHVPAYTQVNLGVAHDFFLYDRKKPLTVRFDVVNLFGTVYQIRDGSGIGVFAPQYGPRRGFFLGISQKI